MMTLNEKRQFVEPITTSHQSDVTIATNYTSDITIATYHQPDITQESALNGACNNALLTSGSKIFEKETLHYGALSKTDDAFGRRNNSISQDKAGKTADQRLIFSRLSAQKQYTLLMLCVASFGTGCGFSLPAPFYPREVCRL